MALANFTLAAASAAPAILPANPAQTLRHDLDDLLYTPEQLEHQSGNEPFSPPNHQRRTKLKKRSGASYLPPPNQYTQYSQPNIPQNPYNSQLHTQIYNQNTRLDFQIENQRVQEINPPRYDNTGQYVHDPTGDYDYDQRNQSGPRREQFVPGYADNPYSNIATTQKPSSRFDSNTNRNVLNTFNFITPTTTPPPITLKRNEGGINPVGRVENNQPGLERPRGFTKVETGSSGGKTQLHAVLDYDDDIDDGVPLTDGAVPAITPLQGPIFLRNGSVPVVPLTSYPTVNNGSFYQIPILWTALSLALGYELQGQIIRGVPCVKRNFQLYCPTAGNTYPLDKIETFIDENKALIKRMYGSFSTPGGSRVRRTPGVPDAHGGDSYFRHVRQANTNSKLPDPQSLNSTGRIDACESKTEIMTPYWALNSARKLRAIVNTKHFEQAIHQEVCSKDTTARCSGDCGCEQKYKWHRLLAYDPDDDCAGIFMDWFLFPSCCVCRCNP